MAIPNMGDRALFDFHSLNHCFTIHRAQSLKYTSWCVLASNPEFDS
jgi:hypothetical protein